jgi:hypothetical protein
LKVHFVADRIPSPDNCSTIDVVMSSPHFASYSWRVRYFLSIAGILFFTPLIKSHSIIGNSPIAPVIIIYWK